MSDERVLSIPGIGTLLVHDLGRVAYAPALERQRATLQRVVERRNAASESTTAHEEDSIVGEVLLVEHEPPVITVTRRPGAQAHVVAPPALLAAAGIERAETDRGGDVTYHGPGQLVVYPILDLQRLGLRIHEYVRLLEETIMRSIQTLGIEGSRDPSATGVWVERDARGNALSQPAKIAAIGVRVSRWVSMHGFALNVTTNLAHFDHIVPCGLAGRPVTSLAALGAAAEIDHLRVIVPEMLTASLVDRRR